MDFLLFVAILASNRNGVVVELRSLLRRRQKTAMHCRPFVGDLPMTR
jgi:hypothetical protein